MQLAAVTGWLGGALESAGWAGVAVAGALGLAWLAALARSFEPPAFPRPASITKPLPDKSRKGLSSLQVTREAQLTETVARYPPG